MADYAGAMAAIEQRLRDHWTQTPIAFENGDTPDVAGDDGLLRPWVLCEVQTLESRIKSIGTPGDHVTVDAGTISLTLFVRRGTGTDEARAMAVRLADIYRTQVFYRQSNDEYVRTWTPRIGPGNPAKSENPSGNWWAITILTPFEFYHRA